MWLVKMEFAPSDGAQERSREDLSEIADAVERRFAPQRMLAHGGAGRFVVFAHVQSPNERAAEAWARDVLYEAVRDFLPDWQLELLEV